jgi:hypothetical protein
MQSLASEIKTRFPEITQRIYRGDDELPYVMMGHVADWLKSDLPHRSDPKIIGRLVDFCSWCENQPSGDTAADDIHTILVVGLYEKLIESESTQALIPRLMPRNEYNKNKQYVVTHCGQDAFDHTLREYKK